MESDVSETISNLTSDTRDKLGTNGRNTRDKKHPLNFNTEPTPIKYPFYHIKSDGFWKLEWKADSPAVPAAPSDKFLRENLAYAMLDNALWDILQEKEVRDFYKAAIIDYYNMK